MKEPPLRLSLGSDAVKIAGQADLARIESDRHWPPTVRGRVVSEDAGFQMG